jgi:hypothetical protein
VRNAVYKQLVHNAIFLFYQSYFTFLLMLIGDRVLFTEAAAMPGVPVVYRLPEDRHTNPDRLNLDRYCLLNL